MDRRTLLTAVLALLVVAGAVGYMLFATRKHHLELTGDILKVRTHQIDPENTLVILDFRVTNPSDVQFLVRRVNLFVDLKDGRQAELDIVSDAEAERALSYYKELGPKHNQTLMIREKIEPGATLDRMIATRYPGTEQQVAERKSFRIRLEDVDGTVAEIVK